MNTNLNSTLIDNSNEKLKLNRIINSLLSDDSINEVCIATGYWDLPGTKLLYDALSLFLKREGTVLKLIIGQEPLLRSYQVNPEKIEERKFPDFYLKRDIELLSDDYIHVANMLDEYCGDEPDSKIQIRVYGQGDVKQFLHAKCYIFKGCENQACGIIGSSNFTQKGLENNAELNYLETNSLIVTYPANENLKGHISWFNRIWEQGEPWSGKFLEEVLRPTPLGKKVKAPQPKPAPYDVYIKYLQSLWGDVVDQENSRILETFLPPEVQKLQYQFDAVNQGYSIMKRHNGFILADVVGLGKTMVGIMIIRRFLEDYSIDGRSRKVLIVTPPAIKKAWVETIELFDSKISGISNYIKFITTGKVDSLLEEEYPDFDDTENIDAAEQYGLILIDESHKFRNSETNMYQAIDALIGQTYPSPYVVLLSATPQNNEPDDLKNQIYLFQREAQNTTLDTIDGRRLDTFFSKKQQEFKEAKKRKDYDTIKGLSEEIREKVLNHLVVRRTRTDLRKYYQDDSAAIRFPEIEGPYPLRYTMDDELSQLFYDTMDIIAPFDPASGEFIIDGPGLKYYRYRAIEYLKDPGNKARYEKRNLTVQGTSARLARIMQILLVKRLDSSFSAFKASLHNLQRYTQNMIDMIEDDSVFICPDIDVNRELNREEKSKKRGREVSREECYDDIRARIKQKKKNNHEYRAKDFDSTYRENLKKDKELIDKLCERWSKNSYDPKIETFMEKLEPLLFSPKINNPNRYDPPKLVIFTEAIDTLNELKRRISLKDHRVLAVTAENRDKKQKVIQENFDANANNKKDDYDVIVTTEVLSEGVNLHRSNVIVNYDTPWNSTRLMQRIGRVNRIGSKEEKVHVFNFMPTAESDAHIDLVNKAHSKLQSFHAMFGEDNKVYTAQEEVDTYGQDPEQLRKMVEGEESPLEKYIAELKEFKEKNPEQYERIRCMKTPLITAQKTDSTEYVFVVKTPSRQGLSICVDSEGNTTDVNTIHTIEMLHCAPNTPPVAVPEKINTMRKKAVDYYIDFFERMKTSKDSKKITDTAIGIIREFFFRSDISDETRQILRQARSIIENGNRQLAKTVIKLNDYIENDDTRLFKTEDRDINAIICNSLQNIRKAANERMREEPGVLIGAAHTSK